MVSDFEITDAQYSRDLNLTDLDSVNSAPSTTPAYTHAYEPLHIHAAQTSTHQ